MNHHALNALEYTKIKETLREYAVSEYGRKLIDALTPYDHLERVTHQICETTEAKNILTKTSAVPLQDLVGVENVMDKLGKGTALLVEELSSIAKLLKNTKRLKQFMESNATLAPMITQYAYSMHALTEVIEAIDRCITNNRIDDHASPALEKIRKKIYIIEGRIKTKLMSFIQSATNKTYLQDTNISIKNNHYVISVKSEYKKEIPGLVIDRSATGSTLFVEPEAVGRMQAELALLKNEEENEEYQIRLYLTMIVEACTREIQINIDTLAHYDFIFAKGKYSKAIDGNPVEMNLNRYIKINNGRHPLLGRNCVPLNFEIGESYHGLVITGPNTGGKTVALKTVGLLTAMAQSGLHLPVDPGSCLSIYSDILVDIGDGQSIEQSLSTFSSHIKNIIGILKSATKYSLVILDEVGAGTDPTEGEGLAIAILDELRKKGSTILATSHFAKVKEYAATQEGLINGSMAFDLGTLRPLYHLHIGKAGESNAFMIALKLGLNKNVIENAHQLTYHEEKDYSQYLENSINRIPEAALYEKASPPKSISKEPEPLYVKEQLYKIGDLVFVQTINQKGLIFSEENKRGEYGVMVRDKKMFVSKKRLTLLIDSKEMYPEDYDFDIVFKSVEYRKKNKLMNKKHVDGLTLEYSEKDLL